LKDWTSMGYFLGNHTYNHADLNKVSPGEFSKEILSNESTLARFSRAEDFKFFRYPFLREGNTAEKRSTVRKFLLEHSYSIAEVTIDFGDYAWNAPYVRCL